MIKTDGERLAEMGTDAQKWADEFMAIFGERRDDIDSGLMIGWFANAIMAGHDEGYSKARDERGGEGGRS